MSRRGSQPLDPEGAKALKQLPEQARSVLETLHARLLRPQRQGEKTKPLSQKEEEALKSFKERIDGEKL